MVMVMPSPTRKTNKCNITCLKPGHSWHLFFNKKTIKESFDSIENKYDNNINVGYAAEYMIDDTLIEKIENKSEMQIAHHLKNSFKLVTIKDNNNIREIELENISENKDSKKILWKASKLISEIQKERWTITLSSRKGFQSLKEFEGTIEKNKIIEICNDNFVKKILEIIPSSEVTSIQELENDKLKKREENE